MFKSLSKWSAPAAILLAVLLFPSGHAAPLTIGDFSFEGNSLAPTGYSTNIGPEWTGANGSNSGNAFEEYITGFSANGTDHLGMENNYSVWQTLTATYQANTRYTLTVAAGNRTGNTSVGNITRYILASPNGTGHTIYATGDFDASTIPGGTFADAPPLVFETPSNTTSVGKTIRILLRSRGLGRSHFDNIRLDAAAIGAPSTATVSNLSATSITANSATLNGTVTNIGAAAPTITFFWGTTDGQSTPASWQNTITLAGTHSGAFSTNIASLQPATTYRYTVRATNTAGTSWVSPSADFETPPLPPVVANTAATGIGPTSATLGANVTSTGGSTPSVTIYYGPSNGGTSAGAWASSVSLGQGSGPLSTLVSGLSHSTTYYFRAFAQNPAGGTWASTSSSFPTLPVTPPVVENDGASGVTGTSANLSGEITSTGNDTPTVTLFYGTTDGGTTPGSWTSSLNLGLQNAGFSGFISGLSASTTYFYRWRATNAAGSSWSAAGTAFSTIALIPSTAVINEFHYNGTDNTSPDEFIELHNPGDLSLDISGWNLSNAVSYTFPTNTSIPAGGYLVVAENPSVIQNKFSTTGVRGPWIGKLSSNGERIDLRDAAGILMDRVDYSAGFPWPTGADGAGSSAELIHPSLDNDLGGSWRSSGSSAATPSVYIAPQASGWKYFKGTEDASDPIDQWRGVAFDDSSWLTGQAGIGYGYNNVEHSTILSDMRGNYSSVYFRKTFTIPTGAIPQQLKLRIRVDDGYVVWINRKEVVRRYVPDGELAYNGVATNHDRAWEEIIIPDADTFLFGGTNLIAVHGFNTSLANSSDFSMDMELSNSVTSSTQPTPARINSVKRATQLIAPQIRQVAHTPTEPLPNQPVSITARITDTDGMGAVGLSYQIVDPGSYIRLTDAAYQTSWTILPMVDNGTNGDLVAGDSTFTALIPSNIQTNRRLIRYRITFADVAGNSQTVPYADDEQPNFAYFVYAGVPSWTGAMRPSLFNSFPATAAQTYPATTLASKPPLHLVADATDVTNCQYNGSFSTTRFRGTVVQRGVVHDHIEFRVRGIGSTYQSGKNKWNIYFNRSRDYQGYDNYGNPYNEKWNNLLVNSNASPWASVHRGSGGVEEAVSHRIYQLAGMAAMNTQFFHFRVIDDAVEASPTDQYTGDLWGLYLGLEPTEGNFLDERGLPDGNIYSIEGNGGDKKHQGPLPPLDSSDWSDFANQLAAGGQTLAWYQQNVDLQSLYTFLAINRLIGNVDVRPGDNYRFYRRSTDNRWVIIPYDLDMQFIAAHHWGGTMDDVVVAGAPNVIRAISRHPELAREYRNRCREILSLMASDNSSSGGQVGQLINEYARFIHPTGETLTWANLDAAMWNLHPRTAGGGDNTGQSSHKGNFFRANYLDGGRGGLGGTASTGSWIRTLTDSDGDSFSTHEGMMQWFVNYATNTWPGGAWNRKAMTGIGTGTDTDANRQRGYGYKYLEFESLYGGWIDCNTNPSTAANTDYPVKPVITHSGSPGFPLNDLTFNSSAFLDPQGANTYAAHEWRIGEVYAPGIAGYVPGTPCRYEIEKVWSSGEIASAPGSILIPLGVTEAGKTYRVRVRHKDSAGNWSYWSNPVQFGATATPPGALIHYWNFNTPITQLDPTQTIGGGTIAVEGTFESGTGQSFAGINARNGDLPGAHLRVNNPATLGTMVSVATPTTGFENIIIQYESRRSGQGAGTQSVSYTLDGTSYTPFTTFTIPDAAPVLMTLDFRPLSGANNNPHFGFRIEFSQGAGGVAGNNRFDNLTVEADALPGLPELLPLGNADWNFATNWSNVSIPNGIGTLAIIGAPGTADRSVNITSPVTIGKLEMDNAGSAFINRIAGTPGTTLTFNGGVTPAWIDADGTGTGHIEFDIPGGAILATDLRLDVSNIEGNPAHGALRLREAWSGPGGLIKQGPGTASLTGVGKTFSGAVLIEQGVLQISQPSTPTQSTSTTVSSGAQLRLTSGNDLNGARIHPFGGPISISGSGRGPEVPAAAPYGIEGALRYQPDIAGTNRAVISSPVTLAAAATIHVEGADNTLEISGVLSGNAQLTKTGAGPLVISGSSPSFSGGIFVSSGMLEIGGNLTNSPIDLAAGTILQGTGSTGAISGTGTVAPNGTTLTAPIFAASNAALVLNQIGLTGNSLIRLTSSAPFPGAPATVDLFVNKPALQTGDRMLGGFFTASSVDLAQSLTSSQVRLLVPDPSGTIIHEGISYRVALPADHLSWSVVETSADFGSGLTSGRTLEVLVGGEPTQFTQWRNLYFANPADASNDAISGPNANPSGDGIANLIRYAHGIGPMDPVLSLLPKLVRSVDRHQFYFRLDLSKPDLVWRVKATNDQSDWRVVLFDSQSTTPIPPLEDGWLPVTLPSHLGTGPATDPRMFTRLEVVLTSP